MKIPKTNFIWQYSNYDESGGGGMLENVKMNALAARKETSFHAHA